MPRRSTADVTKGRAEVVAAAVDLASVEGLEGITIGRLADELRMSKSGLVGRFGNKEGLQRATLAAAVERFTAEVWGPAAGRRPGCRAWRRSSTRGSGICGRQLPRRVLRDDRLGRVRCPAGPAADDVKAAVRRWLGVLEAATVHVVACGVVYLGVAVAAALVIEHAAAA